MKKDNWRIQLTKENLNTVGAYYSKKTCNANCYIESTNINGWLGRYNNAKQDVLDKKDKLYASFFFPDMSLPVITTEEFLKLIGEEEKLPEDWWMEVNNKEEFKEAMKYINEKLEGKVENVHLNYIPYIFPYYVALLPNLGSGNKFGYNNYYLSHYGNNKITMEQLRKEKAVSKEALPEKWAIERTQKNSKVVNEYFNKMLNCDGYSSEDGWLHFPNIKTGKGWYRGEHSTYSLKDEYTPITFEQFKQYVLKQKTMSTQKQIIGYKLIKPEFEQAAALLGRGESGRTLFNCAIGYKDHTIYFADFAITIDALKTAGVLDLWFEPVYKKDVELSVSYTNGTLEVLLKEKDKFIIKGEGEFDISVLRDLAVPAISSTLMGGAFTIAVHPSSIDVGCKKGISIEDVKKVLAAHDKLFGS